MNDHQLRQDVLDELDFEPSVDATHVAVGVHAGVVTLTGFVSNYGQKLGAERAVRRVKGVKAIAEEIEVHLPSDKKVADTEIAERAVDILKWRVGVPADRIAVKVERGIVTLTGRVDWRFQKREAEGAVHALLALPTWSMGSSSTRRARPPRSRQKSSKPYVAAPSWMRRGSSFKPTVARSSSAARSTPGSSAV